MNEWMNTEYVLYTIGDGIPYLCVIIVPLLFGGVVYT